MGTVHVLAVALLIHLPADDLDKAVNVPSVWTPATHVGGLEEAPNSWLWLGSALTVLAIGGVTQLMEDLLPLTLSFYNY